MKIKSILVILIMFILFVFSSTFVIAGCCYGSEGCAEWDEADSQECIDAGGTWTSSSCSSLPECEQGCCVTDCPEAECVIAEKIWCESNGGSWSSGSCSGVAACKSGACCIGEECLFTKKGHCDCIPGTFLEGVSCIPNPCDNGGDVPEFSIYGIITAIIIIGLIVFYILKKKNK